MGLSLLGIAIGAAVQAAYLVTIAVRRTLATWIFDAAMIAAVVTSVALWRFGSAAAWSALVVAGMAAAWFVLTRKELTLPRRAPSLRVAVGGPMASFTATTTDGARFTERDLAARAPAMLVTYRGAWCPYCVTQLGELEREYDALKAAGVTVFALAVDEAAEQLPLERRLRGRVVFLSDPSGASLDAIGVRHAGGIPWYDRLLFGLAPKDIALPATILVASGGRVAFARRATRIDQRPAVSEILRALDQRAGPPPR